MEAAVLASPSVDQLLAASKLRVTKAAWPQLFFSLHSVAGLMVFGRLSAVARGAVEVTAVAAPMNAR